MPSDTGEDLDSTLGAYEIGVMISIFLFGLLTVQTFTYYKKFPNDAWYLRTFVGVIWVLELAHTMLTAHSLYWLSVLKYGQQEFIFEFPPSLVPLLGLSGVIGPAVQKPMDVAMLDVAHDLSSSGRIGCGFPVLLSMEATPNFIQEDQACGGSADCVDCPDGTTDKFGNDDHVDNGKYFKLEVQFTLLIVQIPKLPTVDNFTWLAVVIVICRLFSNSLMASLNARTKLRTLGETVNCVSDINFAGHSTVPHSINIAMTKVTERWNGDAEPQKFQAAESNSTVISSQA
ncbi:hypothetical protein DXG01_016525 [Tephrocybe rancida]|nr:hypothetical protein DXG01_016525 [Tephrocybe rancida]